MAIGENYGAPTNDDTIATLNSFLRGEISAVETYRQAIEKVEDVGLRGTLEELARSHDDRAVRLRNRIAQLGGEPAQGSGPWGGFAKLFEGGAKLFGIKAAVAALEEGEDHGKRLYRDELDKLDASTRSFVELEIMPEQQQTHDMMSRLKHSLH
jgi:uncharacterized protein (TIGR02284 family)